jgi:hypothetical protein
MSSTKNFARNDLFASGNDGVCYFWAWGAKLKIGLRIVVEQNAGDGIILNCPCRMDAIIRRIRYFHFTEGIFFDAEGGHDLKFYDLTGYPYALQKI